MEKKKKKVPTDINQLATYICDVTTGDTKTNDQSLSITNKEPEVREKNPAAVALGRLGGLKGGKARAAKLSPKKRKEIAQKADKARWNQVLQD